MNKKTRAVLVIAVCGISLVLGACHYEGDATVGCSHIEKLQTDVGMLNTPRLLLGNFIIVDPQSKNVGGGLKLITETGDIEVVPQDNSTDLSDASALNITFSGKVPSEFDAQLQSQLAENIQLHVENAERHQIDQLVAVLNRPANQQVLAQIKQRPDEIFLLVWAGVTSTRLTFGLKNGSQNSISLNLGKDSFSGSVNYSCQGDLSQTVTAVNATNTLSFFKVMQVIQTADGKSLSIQPFAGNLEDYNLQQAVY